MKYIKAVAAKAASKTTPWKRSFFPTAGQTFHTTVPGFDILSEQETDRYEFWASESGDLTKEQVDALIYGSGTAITKDTVINTTTDQTLGFEGVKCDRLILTLSNSNAITRSVQILRASDDFRLELLKVPTNQLYTIEIPKPFSSYKLAVPGNFQIKFYPYTLI